MSLRISVKSNINFGKALAAIQSGGARGTKRAVDIVGEAALALTPNDTGALKGSQKCQAEGLKGVIAYGTKPDTAPYARYQHDGQRVDGSHVIKNRPAGGQSKFLEQPINDGGVGRACLEAWGDEIRSELG